jgi:FkbM family methyltransferase
MRRLKILFYWLFIKRNHVSLNDLQYFLQKPNINQLAKKFITKQEEDSEYVKVNFNNITTTLYWPKSFEINRLNQVICETFDTKDWHYYQDEKTSIEQNDVLLDIGAAEGLFTLSVLEKCKKIYLVEPSTIFIESLKKTFSNSLNKIELINKAVGNETAIIQFDENSLDGAITNDKSENSKEVQLDKIDNLISAETKIDYLKADIEGFELEMLKGAENTIKNSKPKIAITTYHDQNNPEEIIQLIKSFVPEYSYKVKGIYEKNPKPVLIHFWIS